MALEKHTFAFLFMDVAGYTRLGSDGLELFIETYLPAINKLVAESEASIEHKNTWGDAVFLAARTAEELGRLALQLRDKFEELGGALQCRIALHSGPAVSAYNPVRDGKDLFGSSVNLTARIEPITPPGEVYATAAFVEQVDPGPSPDERQLAFDSVGDRELAKDFGEQPLYRVRYKDESSRLLPAVAIQVKVVDGPIKGVADDFYGEFRRRLQKTRHNLLLVGSGFSCDTPNGLQRARQYLRVLTGCATRHQVTRVELAEPTMTDWVDMYSTYLAGMPNVRTFVPREGVGSILTDIAVLDHGTDGALVEIGVPVRRDASDGKGEVIGAGVFISSTAIADKVHELIRKQLENFDEVDSTTLRGRFKLPEVVACGERTSLYFAYGSNMDPQVMEARVPSAVSIGQGTLKGYRLVFTRPGIIYSGAVANIKRDAAADRVHGVLYRCNAEELEARLDFYEGVDDGEYKREVVLVTNAENSPVTATVYQALGKDFDGNPSRLYLERLVAGAEKHHLDPNFIQRLKHRFR